MRFGVSMLILNNLYFPSAACYVMCINVFFKVEYIFLNITINFTYNLFLQRSSRLQRISIYKKIRIDISWIKSNDSSKKFVLKKRKLDKVKMYTTANKSHVHFKF